MSTVTRQEVLEKVAAMGPLHNVFLIAEDGDPLGLPMIWYPEIGLRYLIIEKDELAQAVNEYLRCEVNVRRFKSEQEISEAMSQEKWEGWDTCADYRRHQRAVEAIANRCKA